VGEDEAVRGEEVPVGSREEEILEVDAEDEGQKDALWDLKISFDRLAFSEWRVICSIASGIPLLVVNSPS
jgi:hypothetical protein